LAAPSCDGCPRHPTRSCQKEPAGCPNLVRGPQGLAWKDGSRDRGSIFAFSRLPRSGHCRAILSANALVSRSRSSHHCTARLIADFAIEGHWQLTT
jgi:hypothetical protein